jgi:hypothetical protein
VLNSVAGRIEAAPTTMQQSEKCLTNLLKPPESFTQEVRDKTIRDRDITGQLSRLLVLVDPTEVVPPQISRLLALVHTKDAVPPQFSRMEPLIARQEGVLAKLSQLLPLIDSEDAFLIQLSNSLASLSTAVTERIQKFKQALLPRIKTVNNTLSSSEKNILWAIDGLSKSLYSEISLVKEAQRAASARN